MEMINEDIELVMLSRVARNLGITITRAKESLRCGFYHDAIVRELLKEHAKENKIASDCYKMALRLPRAVPMITEYSRARKRVEAIENLISKANGNYLEVKKASR